MPVFDSIITDGRTNGWTDGQTDKASYRVACPQLKTALFRLIDFELQILRYGKTRLTFYDID